MDTTNLSFGIVYLQEHQGFMFFKDKLTQINGTEDVPSGSNLFWCNLTGFELYQRGLTESRFIKDDFFDLRIRVILKELGLDIIKLTSGFEYKNNIKDITKALSFVNDILEGVVVFSQKYLLTGESRESLQLKDIFSYNTFAQAVYACKTKDFKLSIIKENINDIFKNSDELLVEAVEALSRSWVVAESSDDMPSKQEAQLSTVMFIQHRQDLFKEIMSIEIPKGRWTEISLEDINNDADAFLEKNSNKLIMCRIAFEKTDPALSSLLNFGGIKQGLNIASVMNNWMTITELNALKSHLINYSIVNILICEDSGPHPMLGLYQQVKQELGLVGSGWSTSYLSGFLEMHLFESINKKAYFNNLNVKSPAGAYLTSVYRLYSLLFALNVSAEGKGAMKTVDCFWVFAYGMGKVGVRIPLPQDASTTNFDDRVAVVSQKTKLIPPVLKCLSFSEQMPKGSDVTASNIVRWINISGNFDTIQKLLKKKVLPLF